MKSIPISASLTVRKAMRIVVLAVGAAVFSGLSACQGPRAAPGPAPESPFDGQRALALAEEQVEMGPRYPGSDGHRQVQIWIQSTLDEYGWRTSLQTFEKDGVVLLNIDARRDSDAPQILLGAHYDTRPLADQDDTSPDAPVPGANDGASGVAVLLELARVLPTWSRGCQPGLVFFDAEDSGGLSGWDWHEGADFYVENLTQLPEAVVIIDMIGDRDLQIFFDRNSNEELSNRIWERARALGYEAFIPEFKYAMVDDHTPFRLEGVPSALLIDFDYPYWHTTEDTIDKLSADSLEAVGRTVQEWLLLDCHGLLEK